MQNHLRFKQVVTVLLPVLLLFGIVWAIPNGGVLKADDSEQPFTKVKIAGKTVTLSDFLVKEDTVELELTGKETRIVQLPDSEDYQVFPLDKAGNPLTVDEKTPEDATQWQQDLLEKVENKSSDTKETIASTEEAELSETKESTSAKEETPAVLFHVTTGEKKGTTYLQLVKDQPLKLKVTRLRDREGKLILASIEDERETQTLFSFAIPEQTSESTKEKQSQTGTSSESTKNSESEENKNEKSKEKVKNSESAEDKNKKPKDNLKEKVKDDESENTNSNEEVVEKTEENLIVVPTKTTNKTLEELNEAEYSPQDSLKTPLLFGKIESFSDDKNQGRIDEKNPIIVKDAKVLVSTGTAGFDADNNPGHDSGPDNNIVRSFDQVNYRISFSIQNTNFQKSYTNIRYQVVSKLDNAITESSGIPSVNAEISNGTYSSAGIIGGTQYSEGKMESIIGDTGQVFVPVNVSVFGAKHGFKFTPTFQLIIVDAVNRKTGETETFNTKFDSTQLPNLKAPETTVSARRSVAVNLVQGEQSDFQLYKPGATNTDKVYDVGIVASLSAIPGRPAGDLRGSTYPTGPITFEIGQTVTSYKNGTESAVSQSSYPSINTRFYSVTNTDRTKANWKSVGDGVPWASTFNPSRLKEPLSVPNGVTKKIYTSQPTADLKKIGVYDTGTINIANSPYKDTVTLSNYQGVRNPYTYTTAGGNYSSEAFASAELIINWYDDALSKLAASNKWDYYQAKLSIKSVSYDGFTDSNSSSINFIGTGSNKGAWSSGPNFVNLVGYDPETNKMDQASNFDEGSTTWANNIGRPKVFKGQQIYAGGWNISSSTVNPETQIQILEWNTKGFQYDSSRVPYSQIGFNNEKLNVAYGVRKLPSDVPISNVADVKVTDTRYTWYTTPEAAKAAGTIGAAKFTYTRNGNSLSTWNGVPVTVIGETGSKDGSGNPYLLLSSAGALDSKGNIKLGSPGANSTNAYSPTVWSADGTVITGHSSSSGSPRDIGTNAFIKSFGIQTTTEVKQKLYQSTDDIDLTVRGITTGTTTTNYSGSLTTTLPKGINYKSGSSKNASLQKIADPTIVLNADGTSTLKWTSTNFNVNTGIEIRFQATSDFTKLTFNNNGQTSNLNVKTVGEMWVTGNTALKDTSGEIIRSSSDYFVEQLIQQVIISKTHDKEIIEVGDVDDAVSGGKIDNTITYKIKVENKSVDALQNAKLLDVLPYDGDNRGTKFAGTYKIESLKVNDSAATINYSTSSVSDKQDPNTITGWSIYKPGSTPASSIEKAKAILISKPTLGVGESIELEIKIRLTNQKAGDVLVNDAGLNSILDLPVTSQAVRTTVYGRDLKGVAWYDDNKDGLMDTSESKLAGIPVKLYRTSIAKPTYKDELVKQSLTGTNFIDASGNSTIKTDANGAYTFSNLPEGNYVAKFVIEDRITAKEFSVTKKEAGTDEKINSKSSVEAPYKTKAYTLPVLADLPEKVTETDKTYHTNYVHLGVIRLTNKLSITKTLDKTAIEVGDTDPTGTNGKIDNTITYTITVKNEEAAAIPNVKILDVLPFLNDTRGTTLSGSYTVEDVTVNDVNSWIIYTNTVIAEDKNPNAVTYDDWLPYTPGTTPSANLKNAKSILVGRTKLDKDESIVITVKLKPTGQKSGELLKNDASVNSGLNNGENTPLRSSIVTTTVYGRDLTGVAWYDDNKDGLMGTSEPKLAGIPVKLYRTSIAKPTYKDELVKQSLTGTNFIDASGNSTIKTDAKGAYTFSNLPEGNYVAKFVIEDRITAKEFSVTKKEAGADEKINSKSSVEAPYKTKSYTLPVLADLPAEVTATDKTYHTNYVHLGVIRLTNKLSITKTLNKTAIEVGDTDPTGTNGKIDNTITYTITVKNEEAAAVPNVKILDVLPFLNDTRGTTLSGSYTVEDITVNDVNSWIIYTNTVIAEDKNPNAVTYDDWLPYTPGTTPSANLKNAKSILVGRTKLNKDESIVITVKLKPTGQKSGELLKNDASVNSGLNNGENTPLRSQIVTTKVYSRDLTGFAWYDDSYDGLFGSLSNGSTEDYAKDIPVKLYRTSLATPTYKNQLVKQSLTGESFIDASGNSTVKTDAKGAYTFSNLPEGTYVAEFVVHNQVVAKSFGITKQNAGGSAKEAINSKADQTTYKTGNYTQPLLSELPAKTTSSDSVYHVLYVNVGLTHSWTIQLFKYVAGTAIDANKDGVLSDSEKATGSPLEGAEFTIYKGTEVKDSAKAGTAVTGKDGKLVFEFLFDSDYVLVETKAPSGYELLKEPIPVKAKEANQTIMVYQEDKKTTDLPFTGGNGLIQLFLVISGGSMLAGLGGIWWHFRLPNKKGRVR